MTNPSDRDFFWWCGWVLAYPIRLAWCWAICVIAAAIPEGFEEFEP